MRKRLIACLLALLVFCSAGCYSISESAGESKFMPQINPYDMDAQNTAQSVRLYYPVSGEPYLSSFTTMVDVHTGAGDTLQEALVRELMKDPPQGFVLDPVFVDGLRRVSMQRRDDTLTIVLSREILSVGARRGDDSALARQLTLYAIINTMTDNGDIASVQILVDLDNNGRPKVPTRREMGFLGADEDDPLGPLSFSNAWILTADAAARTVLNAGIAKDAARMRRLLSQSVLSPDAQTLQTRLQSASALIVDYYVTGTTFSADNQQATIYVDITYELLDRSIKQMFNQPITLRRERDAWKAEYSSVEMLLFP